jgi:predicted  nucleic acid-binding Zn-ribbon protein
MAWFRNHYWCDRCGHRWRDEWSATCDDDCPNCGARHMSPHWSEDAEEADEQDRLSQ